MKKLKPSFFYLLNFIAVWQLGFVKASFAQQSCRSYANSQSSSTPGASVINNESYDIASADTTDYTTLTVNLNALSIVTAYQSLVFPTTAQANVPLFLKIGGAASTLGVASQISIQAYNNTTAVGNPITGASLLSLLGTSGISIIRFNPPGAYNSVRISISSTLSLGSSINIFYAYQDISPSASFTINQPIQCLEGNNFIFSNTSTVNSGTLTYSWNFGDGMATSALTSPAHVYTAAGIYTVKLTATTANGCTATATQIVTVIGGLFTGNLAGLPFSWVGAAGADWGTASNWRVLSSSYYYLPPAPPTASNSVSIGIATTIGCTQAVQQVITVGAGTIAQCLDLNLGSNAIVQVTGSLTINGNLSDASSGTNGMRGSSTGKLTFTGTGTSSSLRFATGYQQLASLELTRTNGASAPVTLTSPLTVFNYVNLSANNILDSQSGNLTLKSSQSSTASIYALPSGAIIKGTVNTERFFNGGGSPTGSAAYRSYRLISSPVSNISYNYNGTQATPVYNLNYIKAAAIITGAASGGFDKTGNPTFYLYREDVNSNNASFTSGNFRGISKIDPASNSIGTQSRFNLNNVADTTIQLPAGNGVLFFFRGDNTNLSGKTTAPFAPPQNVTFTNSGVINQGNIPVKIWFKPSANLSYTNNAAVSNAGVRGYNLVGNPYPCTINWNTNSAKTTSNAGIVFSSVTDVDTKMYVFDPVAKTYSWFDSSIGTTGGNDGNPNVSSYISSGQGFFVRAKNSNATLTFTEAAKINNQSSQALLGFSAASNDLADIKIQLKMDSVNYDYTAIYFQKNWNAGYDIDEDAVDMDGNGNTVNLSSYSADLKRLAINKLPDLINQPNRIPLYVKGNSGNYALMFPEISNIPAQYTVFLKDNFKGDSLKVTSNSSYSFQIDQADPKSYGDKRFELVFNLPDHTAYRLLSFSGIQNPQGFTLNWTTENEGNYTSFTLEKSTDGGKTFTAIDSVQSSFKSSYTSIDTKPVPDENIFRLKQNDLYNQITYSTLVNMEWKTAASNQKSFSFYPNPAINQLNISLIKEQKGMVRSRIINMQGNEVIKQSFSSAKWIQSIQNLSPGIYAIQLQNVSTGAIIGQEKFIKK